jgi:hypothetical protein
VNFLRRKVAEYEMLKREIEELQADASRASQPKATEAASPGS